MNHQNLMGLWLFLNEWLLSFRFIPSRFQNGRGKRFLWDKVIKKYQQVLIPVNCTNKNNPTSICDIEDFGSNTRLRKAHPMSSQGCWINGFLFLPVRAKTRKLRNIETKKHVATKLGISSNHASLWLRLQRITQPSPRIPKMKLNSPRVACKTQQKLAISRICIKIWDLPNLGKRWKKAGPRLLWLRWLLAFQLNQGTSWIHGCQWLLQLEHWPIWRTQMPQWGSPHPIPPWHSRRVGGNEETACWRYFLCGKSQLNWIHDRGHAVQEGQYVESHQFSTSTNSFNCLQVVTNLFPGLGECPHAYPWNHQNQQ